MHKNLVKKKMISPPSILLSLTELARTGIDATRLSLNSKTLSSLPSGDGHRVIVIPGFMGSSLSTGFIRSFLRSKKYDAIDWGLGRNIGEKSIGVFGDILLEKIVSMSAGKRVSIVGWSLGGLMAREVARAVPGLVRQVISLGSPFRDGHNSTHIWHMYRIINNAPDIDPTVIELMKTPPPVPSTSVYTKSDGVVHWKSCIEDDTPTTDNIEVDGSHCGLGFNPDVMGVLAAKLSMKDGCWQKIG